MSFLRAARPRVASALALVLVGCGARSELVASGGRPASCGPIHVDDFMVHAACGIETLAPVDAEGFVSVQDCPDCLGFGYICGDVPYELHRVLALNRLGAGHVIGWCDSSLTSSLMSWLKVRRYLGGSASPRVATVGAYPCDVGDGAYDHIDDTTFLGAALPADYQDGAALAADWDVLIACGRHTDLGEAFAPMVLDFVRDHGGGLLALADYVCPGAVPETGVAQMNAVVGEAGMAFEPLNLAWGDGEIDLECVPDYPAD